MKHQLVVSVGLATRDAGDPAVRSMSSVAGQLGAEDELIVVYTGDHEPDAEPLRTWLQTHCPSGRLLIRLQTGISEARNAILEEARAPIVCFLDDDETAAAGWLDAYRRAWTGAPSELAMIGGPIDAHWDGRRAPWLHDHLLHIAGVLELGDERIVLDQAPGTGFAWGGNMSVRKSEALEVGGFDQHLGPRPAAPFERGEDEEVQKRLVATGRQIWYEPNARITHHIRSDRLSLAYFSRIVRSEARGDAERPFALLRGVRRLVRSSTRYVLGFLRRDTAERNVARLGVSQGLALVGGALKAHTGKAEAVSLPGTEAARRVGLVAPLPPQVGGVASFAGWLVEHERSIGCRYEPFDLWRPAEAEAGGRARVAPALRQVRLLARFALWLRLAPDLVHVCISYTATGVLRDLLFVALARASGRRVIAHVHGAELTGGSHRVRALALQAIARLSAETVALAPSSRAALRRLGIEASVVFNPIRLGGTAASPPAREGAVCRALFVGTYGRRKGVAELIEAIAQLRREGVSIELELAGKEEFRGEEADLRLRVHEFALTDFVRFHGVLGTPALRDLYESSHVFVLPSRSEGLPMALLEAMAFRLPVVATHVGGIPDVIEDGESGLLIPPARTGELTDALRRLTADPRLRERLGKLAQARVHEFASAEIVAERWRTIYSKHERELVRCA